MRRIRPTASLAALFALGGLAAAQPSDDDLPFLEVNGERVPLFMHAGTFADGTTGYGWARDDVEMEATTTASCVPGEEMDALLRADDMRNFRRLRRSPAMEAFSSGFPLDEVPWGGDTHAVREGRIPWDDEAKAIPPHVWLTLESDRFAVDPESGRRELSVGTDVMDDIYYDTDDFLLLKNGISVRARKRWDSGNEMRRLLIALKVESGVDSFGIKRAAKTDVRCDSPDVAAINSLSLAVPRGIDSWSNKPAVPLRRAYELLRSRGALFSTPSYKDVLVLKPKAFVRSIRSRYHLDETSISELRELHELGRKRLEALATMAREARMDGALPSGRVADVEAFEAKVRGALSGDLVAERAKAALAALGFSATDGASLKDLLPGSQGPAASTSPADVAARRPLVEQRRVVAETISALFHELAADLDDGSDESLRRLITRSMDRSQEDHVEWFAAWRESLDPELRRVRTVDKLHELHAGLLTDPAHRAAYNEFGKQRRADGDRDFRRFRPLGEDRFAELRFQLRNEMARIWGRQVETAGSAARGLWFDEARAFYVPRSRRSYGNFIIDTMDYSAMYSADVWGDLPEAERTPAVDLSQPPYRDKLLHATLVNEVQIELLEGSEHVRRLKELRALTALPGYFMRWASESGQATDIDGAKRLFEELKALGDDDLAGKLAPLNAYMAAHQSPISSIDPDEFREWLDPARLREDVRDDPAYSEPEVEVALEGAKFVFEQYRDMLNHVARLKEDRVRSTLRRAGAPGCMEWVPAEASKGNIALSILARRAAADANGLVGGVGGAGGGN